MLILQVTPPVPLLTSTPSNSPSLGRHQTMVHVPGMCMYVLSLTPSPSLSSHPRPSPLGHWTVCSMYPCFQVILISSLDTYMTTYAFLTGLAVFWLDIAQDTPLFLKIFLRGPFWQRIIGTSPGLAELLKEFCSRFKQLALGGSPAVIELACWLMGKVQEGDARVGQWFLGRSIQRINTLAAKLGFQDNFRSWGQARKRQSPSIHIVELVK